LIAPEPSARARTLAAAATDEACNARYRRDAATMLRARARARARCGQLYARSTARNLLRSSLIEELLGEIELFAEGIAITVR